MVIQTPPSLLNCRTKEDYLKGKLEQIQKESLKRIRTKVFEKRANLKAQELEKEIESRLGYDVPSNIIQKIATPEGYKVSINQEKLNKFLLVKNKEEANLRVQELKEQLKEQLISQYKNELSDDVISKIKNIVESVIKKEVSPEGYKVYVDGKKLNELLTDLNKTIAYKKAEAYLNDLMNNIKGYTSVSSLPLDILKIKYFPTGYSITLDENKAKRYLIPAYTKQADESFNKLKVELESQLGIKIPNDKIKDIIKKEVSLKGYKVYVDQNALNKFINEYNEQKIEEKKKELEKEIKNQYNIDITDDDIVTKTVDGKVQIKLNEKGLKKVENALEEKLWKQIEKTYGVDISSKIISENLNIKDSLVYVQDGEVKVNKNKLNEISKKAKDLKIDTAKVNLEKQLKSMLDGINIDWNKAIKTIESNDSIEVSVNKDYFKKLEKQFNVETPAYKLDSSFKEIEVPSIEEQVKSMIGGTWVHDGKVMHIVDAWVSGDYAYYKTKEGITIKQKIETLADGTKIIPNINYRRKGNIRDIVLKGLESEIFKTGAIDSNSHKLLDLQNLIEDVENLGGNIGKWRHGGSELSVWTKWKHEDPWEKVDKRDLLEWKERLASKSEYWAEQIAKATTLEELNNIVKRARNSIVSRAIEYVKKTGDIYYGWGDNVKKLEELDKLIPDDIDKLTKISAITGDLQIDLDKINQLKKEVVKNFLNDASNMYGEVNKEKAKELAKKVHDLLNQANKTTDKTEYYSLLAKARRLNEKIKKYDPSQAYSEWEIKVISSANLIEKVNKFNKAIDVDTKIKVLNEIKEMPQVSNLISTKQIKGLESKLIQLKKQQSLTEKDMVITEISNSKTIKLPEGTIPLYQQSTPKGEITYYLPISGKEYKKAWVKNLMKEQKIDSDLEKIVKKTEEKYKNIHNDILIDFSAIEVNKKNPYRETTTSKGIKQVGEKISDFLRVNPLTKKINEITGKVENVIYNEDSELPAPIKYGTALSVGLAKGFVNLPAGIVEQASYTLGEVEKSIERKSFKPIEKMFVTGIKSFTNTIVRASKGDIRAIEQIGEMIPQTVILGRASAGKFGKIGKAVATVDDISDALIGVKIFEPVIPIAGKVAKAPVKLIKGVKSLRDTNFEKLLDSEVKIDKLKLKGKEFDYDADTFTKKYGINGDLSLELKVNENKAKNWLERTVAEDLKMRLKGNNKIELGEFNLGNLFEELKVDLDKVATKKVNGVKITEGEGKLTTRYYYEIPEKLGKFKTELKDLKSVEDILVKRKSVDINSVDLETGRTFNVENYITKIEGKPLLKISKRELKTDIANVVGQKIKVGTLKEPDFVVSDIFRTVRNIDKYTTITQPKKGFIFAGTYKATEKIRRRGSIAKVGDIERLVEGYGMNVPSTFRELKKGIKVFKRVKEKEGITLIKPSRKTGKITSLKGFEELLGLKENNILTNKRYTFGREKVNEGIIAKTDLKTDIKEDLIKDITKARVKSEEELNKLIERRVKEKVEDILNEKVEPRINEEIKRKIKEKFKNKNIKRKYDLAVDFERGLNEFENILNIEKQKLKQQQKQQQIQMQKLKQKIEQNVMQPLKLKQNIALKQSVGLKQNIRLRQDKKLRQALKQDVLLKQALKQDIKQDLKLEDIKVDIPPDVPKVDFKIDERIEPEPGKLDLRKTEEKTMKVKRKKDNKIDLIKEVEKLIAYNPFKGGKKIKPKKKKRKRKKKKK